MRGPERGDTFNVLPKAAALPCLIAPLKAAADERSAMFLFILVLAAHAAFAYCRGVEPLRCVKLDHRKLGFSV